MAAPALSPEEIRRLNARFAGAEPAEMLRWAVETFRPDVALTSSFGADSAALIHLAVQVDPAISIRVVDTGFLFPETLQFIEQLTAQLHLNVQVVKTALDQPTIDRLTREHAAGKPVDDRYCCGAYKREAVERTLAGLRCWITGLMRAEAVTRRDTPFVEALATGMIKVAPLAAWTTPQVYAYLRAHTLPFHPLWAQGYTSIGCRLHTQKPLDPNDPRSGRWAGQDKTECGIHDIGKTPPRAPDAPER